ncbi:MAG: KxYKxGKxW signal peptide domain-containing protein, partial [Lactobacillaceae bacterium]|nr:KxYKxGKxW signal peptide domain-containing protein [Lactobacillaceae bacterium]
MRVKLYKSGKLWVTAAAAGIAATLANVNAFADVTDTVNQTNSPANEKNDSTLTNLNIKAVADAQGTSVIATSINDVAQSTQSTFAAVVISEAQPDAETQISTSESIYFPQSDSNTSTVAAVPSVTPISATSTETQTNKFENLPFKPAVDPSSDIAKSLNALVDNTSDTLKYYLSADSKTLFYKSTVSDLQHYYGIYNDDDVSKIKAWGVENGYSTNQLLNALMDQNALNRLNGLLTQVPKDIYVVVYPSSLNWTLQFYTPETQAGNDFANFNTPLAKSIAQFSSDYGVVLQTGPRTENGNKTNPGSHQINTTVFGEEASSFISTIFKLPIVNSDGSVSYKDAVTDAVYPSNLVNRINNDQVKLNGMD